MEIQEKNPQNREEKPKKQAAYFMLAEIGLEFAVIIAAPLIIFVLAGKWAAARYGSKLYIVAAILLALALSSYMIAQKIKQVKNFLK